MSVREEGRSYALPKRPGKQMDEQAVSLMKSVRFTIDERQHIEHDSNENEEDHRGECALGLARIFHDGSSRNR